MAVIEALAPPARPLRATRPRLRGWLHTYAFFLAVAAGTGLGSLTVVDGHPLIPVLGTVIYVITVCGLLGTSALFHRGSWSPRGYRVMQRLDHSMIFVLIAGTYTPLAVLLLSPAKSSVVLGVVWAGAAVGVGIKLFGRRVPRALSTVLYLGLGWAGVALLPDIARVAGPVVLTLTIAGGLFYSVGAVVYAIRRPSPWPATFGYHEVFHALTIVAATCHFLAIYLAVTHLTR